MLKDAEGNELKKGDWYICGAEIGCIYAISRWRFKAFTCTNWDEFCDYNYPHIYSEEIIKIESLKSSSFIKNYLTICSSQPFKEFVSRNKKTYKPLTLIDSPFCGS